VKLLENDVFLLAGVLVCWHACFWRKCMTFEEEEEEEEEGKIVRRHLRHRPGSF
jgi:hypothetical protein